MPAGKTAEPTDWNWLPVAVGKAWMAPNGAVVVGCDQAPRRRAISSVRILINPLQLFPVLRRSLANNPADSSLTLDMRAAPLSANR